MRRLRLWESLGDSRSALSLASNSVTCSSFAIRASAVTHDVKGLVASCIHTFSAAHLGPLLRQHGGRWNNVWSEIGSASTEFTRALYGDCRRHVLVVWDVLGVREPRTPRLRRCAKGACSQPAEMSFADRSRGMCRVTDMAIASEGQKFTHVCRGAMAACDGAVHSDLVARLSPCGIAHLHPSQYSIALTGSLGPSMLESAQSEMLSSASVAAVPWTHKTVGTRAHSMHCWTETIECDYAHRSPCRRDCRRLHAAVTRIRDYGGEAGLKDTFHSFAAAAARRVGEEARAPVFPYALKWKIVTRDPLWSSAFATGSRLSRRPSLSTRYDTPP
jgi:hypothetical protein